MTFSHMCPYEPAASVSVSVHIVSRGLYMHQPIQCNDFIVPLGGCCVLSSALYVLVDLPPHLKGFFFTLLSSVNDINVPLLSVKVTSQTILSCTVLDYFASGEHCLKRTGQDSRMSRTQATQGRKEKNLITQDVAPNYVFTLNYTCPQIPPGLEPL